jgi:hypothetical protein
MQEAQDLLSLFGKNIGIEGLVFDKDKTCTLSFDDIQVVIELVEEKRLFYIYSFVMPLSENIEKMSVYQFLLEQNSFFKGTGGGTFGIEPDMKSITYTTLFALRDAREDTVAFFADVVGNHVTAVEGMRVALHDLLQAEPAAEAFASEDTVFMNTAIRI